MSTHIELINSDGSKMLKLKTEILDVRKEPNTGKAIIGFWVYKSSGMVREGKYLNPVIKESSRQAGHTVLGNSYKQIRKRLLK